MADGDPIIPPSSEAIARLERAAALWEQIKNNQSASSDYLSKEGDTLLFFTSMLQEHRSLYEELDHIQKGLPETQKKTALLLKEEIRDRESVLLNATKFYNLTESQVKITAEQVEQAKYLQAIEEKRLMAQEKLDERTARVKAKERIDAYFSGQLMGAESDANSRVLSGIMGIGSRLANVVGLQMQSEFVGLRGRAAALMTGANIPVASGAAGAREAGAAAAAMFGGLPTGVMSPIERLQQFNKIMSEAPKLYKDSGDGMTILIGTLANFGSTIEESVATLIKAQRELNMGSRDVASAYRMSNFIARDLGLSTKETADILLGMTKAVRGVGGDSGIAARILEAFSKDIKAAGIDLSALEKAEMAQRFAMGIGNMPVQKLIGLTMYATGKPITGIGPGDLEGPAAFTTTRKIFERILSQTGQSYAEQVLATQKISELVGVNASSYRDVEQLRKIMADSSLDQKSMAEAIEAIKDPATATRDGIRRLTDMVDPLKSIDNTVKKMQLMMMPQTVLQAVQYLQSIQMTLASMKLLEAGGVLAPVATALGMSAGTRATVGLLGRSALRVGATAAGIAAPVVGLALAGSAVYDAYNFMHQDNIK